MPTIETTINIDELIESAIDVAAEPPAEPPLTCNRCGAIIEDESEMVLASDGSVFCDFDCAHDNGYKCCARCGEWTDDYITVEGIDEVYCSETCASSNGNFYCDNCERWYHELPWSERMRLIREGLPTIGSERHEVIGRWHDAYDWCDDCYEDGAYYCEGCGQTFDGSYEDMHQDAYGDWYCESCWEDRNEGHEDLHCYGWTPHPLWFYDGGAATRRAEQHEEPYLGVELETDARGSASRSEYCDDLVSIAEFLDRFWMTEDGSLDNGVEITSHPATLWEHVNCGIWEQISEVAADNGFRSHDAGTCGLHIHVNRDFFGNSEKAQDVAGYKMMRLLQRFEHQFTTFSRRADNGWCRYQTYNSYEPVKKGGKVLDTHADLMRKAQRMSGETNHSQALNFQHDATFEFRIFRGTLKLDTLFASMALVNGLCHVAKTHGSRYVENVAWYDLMDDVVEACDYEEARKMLVAYLDEKELRNITPKTEKKPEPRNVGVIPMYGAAA